MSGGFAARPPLKTLAVAYRAYEDLAAASHALKVRHESASVWALGLGIGAGICGTLAPLLEESSAKPLGLASAALLAIGGYVGKEFLTPSGETEWAKLRLRAEALQREVWKAAMCVPPYAGTDAARVLDRETARLSRPSPSVPGAPGGKAPPSPNDVAAYIAERVVEQQNYYRSNAAKHISTLAKLRRLVLVAGLMAVGAGAVSSLQPRFGALVAILTTVSAALVASIQSRRLEALIPQSRDTARDLELLVAEWEDDAQRRAGLSTVEQSEEAARFVLACEEVMARENHSWRTAWLDAEQLQSSQKLLEKARNQAEVAAAGQQLEKQSN